MIGARALAAVPIGLLLGCLVVHFAAGFADGDPVTVFVARPLKDVRLIRACLSHGARVCVARVIFESPRWGICFQPR